MLVINTVATERVRAQVVSAIILLEKSACLFEVGCLLEACSVAHLCRHDTAGASSTIGSIHKAWRAFVPSATAVSDGKGVEHVQLPVSFIRKRSTVPVLVYLGGDCGLHEVFIFLARIKVDKVGRRLKAMIFILFN